MNEPTIHDRLSRLERSNRRLKVALGACCCAAVAWVGLGAVETPKVLTAEAFKLVDSAGKLRAAWGSDKDGTFFFLNDPDGKMRTSMAAQKIGAYIDFRDEESTPGGVLAFDDRGPGLRFKDGNSLANIAWDKNGPLLHLQDENGKSRFLTSNSDIVQDPPPQEEEKAQQPGQPAPAQPAPNIGPRR